MGRSFSISLVANGKTGINKGKFNFFAISEPKTQPRDFLALLVISFIDLPLPVLFDSTIKYFASEVFFEVFNK